MLALAKKSREGVALTDWLGAAAPWNPGNLSAADIKTACDVLCTRSGFDTMARPVAGGTLTINSVALGSYDVVIKRGNQTVSVFDPGDWFTTTADSRSAIVIVDGNLTINAGQTFIPPVRKLFFVLYVTGTLTINGALSMTARGANHSASGSNITAGAIKIATGTFSTIVDPNVPAAGGAGGATTSGAGTAGASGGTGGGGAGASGGTFGAGAAGTSFSGGPGGGGAATAGVATAGAANGSAGGNGASDASNGGGGGAGNPGGTFNAVNFPCGTGQGTGGTLIVIVPNTGTSYTGTGTVAAEGVGSLGSGNGVYGGGGSGGGSVTVMTKTTTGPTPSVTGGASSGGVIGGAGGAGTQRILIIP